VNEFAPDVYTELVHRLAVGFEPVDPLPGSRLLHAVRVEPEGLLPWHPLDPEECRRAGSPRRIWRRAPAGHDLRCSPDPVPRVDRHGSGLHALLVQPGLAESLDLRLYDTNRSYVPRRFRLDLDVLPQVRRPALFPGSAYDLSPRKTGLRGRVTSDGEPLRWVRVEARLPGPDVLVGRAHGDDRGEFLLLLAPEAAPFADLADPLEIRVSVFGSVPPPVPDSPTLPDQDAYRDLPLETLAPPAENDPVAAGEVLPTGYASTPSSVLTVPFRLGRIISRIDGLLDFEF
jgi:hypothetical protein